MDAQSSGMKRPRPSIGDANQHQAGGHLYRSGGEIVEGVPRVCAGPTAAGNSPVVKRSQRPFLTMAAVLPNSSYRITHPDRTPSTAARCSVGAQTGLLK